jgi:hypothetical protein
MEQFINEFLNNRLIRLFKNTVAAVREINKKYAVPQIKTTKPVQFALLLLRVYLILLLVLLFFKFFTVISN